MMGGHDDHIEWQLRKDVPRILLSKGLTREQIDGLPWATQMRYVLDEAWHPEKPSGAESSAKANGHAPASAEPTEPPPQPNDGYTVQIQAAMRDYGIEMPPDIFVADGRFHRFRSRSGSQKTNGWYVIHSNPVMTTWMIGDWSQPDAKSPTKNRRCGRGNAARDLTPDEWVEYHRQLREDQKQHDAARLKAWEEAAADAQLRWDALKPAPASHAYLKKKQIKSFGARIDHGNLVIPLRDIGGKLWSLQEIGEDWKSNQKGGRRKSCFTQIGDFASDGPICICEGFATGASLHMATGYGVACAGDAGNLERVAKAIRRKYPDALLLICGDDDWLARYENGVKQNTGRIRAEWAAKAVDGVAAYPWFNPDGARPPKATDFNDEHTQYGLSEVKFTIEETIRQYEETCQKAEERERASEPPPVSGPKDYGLPASAADDMEWPDINRYGQPSPTCANARGAIEMLGITCRYDIFHDRMLAGGHVIEQWAGELSDHACQMLRVVIKERFGFDPGREHTHDAAVQIGLQNQFDPVLEYLSGLNWDRTVRLDKWVCDYLGAQDTPLNRTIGRLSLIAAVRRVRKPGCKFDQIIVLESKEGKGKSTAIEILAGIENFSDQTIIGLDDRQQQEAMGGVWLYEIADLAGMSKADVDKIKAFASRKEERARPAYGRRKVSQKRRCIFFATTNNDTYLKSETGNRRFWPVETGKVNLEALRRDRDQLWAEAAVAEASGVSIVLPEDLWGIAAIEQDKRREADPWEEILGRACGVICDRADGQGLEERIHVLELLKIHLQLPADKCTDATTKRLTNVMRRLGWTRPASAIRIPGKGQGRGFVRPVIQRDEEDG